MTDVKAPAPQPCHSCPYRQDVPSGVWDREEYEKLPTFDDPMGSVRVFLCHVGTGRLCAGWAGCHDMPNMLGLRVLFARERISLADLEATWDYTTDVALWSSGREACDYGLRDVDRPSMEAVVTTKRVATYANRKLVRIVSDDRESDAVAWSIRPIENGLWEVMRDGHPVLTTDDPKFAGQYLQDHCANVTLPHLEA